MRACLPALLLFLLAAPLLHGAEPERLKLIIGAAEVEFHPGDAGPAREAAASVEVAAGRIAERLGLTLRRPVRIVLARGRGEFDRLCGTAMPEWALAAALPERELMVADVGRATPATANDLSLAIIHETVHLALGQVEAGRRDRLPRWFHEGVACWLSGARPLNADWGLFEEAAAHRALIPLDRLTDSFPAAPREAQLAYLQSEAFILHLVTVQPDALRRVLERYRDGEDFERAFTGAVGASRTQTEREWAQSLHRTFPWLRTLVRSLSFWAVMAIATVLAFLIIRRRSRRQREAWDREEQEWHVVDSEEEAEDEPGDWEEEGEEWKRPRE